MYLMAPSVSDNPPGCDEEPTEEETTDEVASAVNAIMPVFTSDSEDSAEEDFANQGYELLPQELDGLENATEQDDSMSWRDFQYSITVEQNAAHVSSYNEEPDVMTENVATSASSDSISMDQDQVEKIKLLMAGFTLPSTSIPSWANDVPEEMWKDRLMSLMTSHNEKLRYESYKKKSSQATEDSDEYSER